MSAVRQFKAVEEMQGGAPGAVRIALAGNPNCGKTTVFNGYTGARQHVGNYPGVTVDTVITLRGAAGSPNRS